MKGIIGPREIYRALHIKYAFYYEKYLIDFSFIHINKTGGSSIRKTLHLPHEHHTVREKISYLGREEWDRRFTFTFIRNPYDRLVSQYHHRKSREDFLVDFKTWVHQVYRDLDPIFDTSRNPRMRSSQVEWLQDQNGELAVDWIGRFESLQDDFNSLCDILGRQQIILPHIKKSKRKPYQEYYDQDTFDLATELFSDDLERFGYKFED